MSKNKRRPILYNGQVYVKPVVKKSGFGDKVMRFSYEEARGSILKNISETKNIIRNLPSSSRLPNEIVLSLILQPEFSAKSYYPSTLFDFESKKFGLKEIGSRVWREKEVLFNDEANEDELVLSKMLFVRATKDSLFNFENHLNKSESQLKDNFINDIRKIASFGLISTEQQILGVSDEWEEGRLEAVLHPFDIDRDKTINHFLKLIESAGTERDTVRYKQYDSGVTFVSFKGNRNLLDSLSGYNPLRTIHPLKMRDLPNLTRGKSIDGGPTVPIFSKKSPIVIGVIDGGFDKNNPYAKNYTDSEFSVSGKPLPSYVEHGTQVTGTVLYGPLNSYSKGQVLPEPLVSVKNFGVISTHTSDPELYEAIDAIEKIIPNNKEINVYNLSLGPAGPILDDSISRFTYSCDLLSSKHNVLFCIAVGNDGNIPNYDRIQSPSDSVNSLAVGAYTNRFGVNMKAPYSSIGPGREGCKMKPDLLAFGGCDQHPIHLISSDLNKKIWSAGTSFASPIVASLAGRLIGESNKTVDSLIARALLIHSATLKNSVGHDKEMGHGIIPSNIEDIVTCEDKSYTLIYRGEIPPGKYAEFQIPWDDQIDKGKAKVSWTVAVLTDVDQLSSDDYTSSSVEVTFYPNRNKFLYRNETGIDLDGVKKKTEIVDITIKPERAKYLEENGWIKSNFPVTDSPKSQFITERELINDLKWDSLDTREVTKYAKNLTEPVFHIHALGRGSRINSKKVKFALILSVETPKAEIDLYTNVLSKYNALVPLQIKNSLQVETEVNTKNY